MLSAHRHRERKAAGREEKGRAGGVKRERQRRTGKKTSVDSDRKKTEAAHVPVSPPPDPHIPPNPISPPSTADKHMWADNTTLPVKRGRDKQGEREREGGPGASEALTSSTLTADGGRLGSRTHMTVNHLLPHTHPCPSLSSIQTPPPQIQKFMQRLSSTFLHLHCKLSPLSKHKETHTLTHIFPEKVSPIDSQGSNNRIKMQVRGNNAQTRLLRASSRTPSAYYCTQQISITIMSVIPMTQVPSHNPDSSCGYRWTYEHT